MKHFIFFIFLLSHFTAFSQNISSINSGTYSGNGLTHVVGEIYVIPDNVNEEVNSGILGILSQIEFMTVSTNEILSSEDVRVFPNPTSHSISFSIKGWNIAEIFIYDAEGKLVSTHPWTGQKIDMSELPKGVYFIKTNQIQLQTLKIIKQ